MLRTVLRHFGALEAASSLCHEGPAASAALAGMGLRLLATSTGSEKTPKKAKSAYNYFVSSKYHEVKQSNPGMTHTDLLKQMKIVYGSLPEVEKNKYVALSNEDKKTTSTARAQFKTRKATAWQTFTKENYGIIATELNTKENNAIMKELSVRWKALTKAEQAEYAT